MPLVRERGASLLRSPNLPPLPTNINLHTLLPKVVKPFPWDCSPFTLSEGLKSQKSRYPPLLSKAQVGIWEQKSGAYLQKHPHASNSSFIGTQNRREQSRICVCDQACVALCTKCRCWFWTQYLWEQCTSPPRLKCRSQQSLQKRGRQRERMGSIPGSWNRPTELSSTLGKAVWLQPATLTMNVCNEEYILHRMHLFWGKGSKRHWKEDSEGYCLSTDWTCVFWWLEYSVIHRKGFSYYV